MISSSRGKDTASFIVRNKKGNDSVYHPTQQMEPQLFGLICEIFLTVGSFISVWFIFSLLTKEEKTYFLLWTFFPLFFFFFIEFMGVTLGTENFYIFRCIHMERSPMDIYIYIYWEKMFRQTNVPDSYYLSKK